MYQDFQRASKSLAAAIAIAHAAAKHMLFLPTRILLARYLTGLENCETTSLYSIIITKSFDQIKCLLNKLDLRILYF